MTLQIMCIILSSRVHSLQLTDTFIFYIDEFQNKVEYGIEGQTRFVWLKK